MEGSAILTLLKARSQNNSYSQAVNSTYLMATGAQRQHFSVFSSLGISMGYTSVLNQNVGSTGKAKESVDCEDIEEMPALVEPELDDDDEMEGSPALETLNAKVSELEKMQRTRTLGTLSELSQACRATAQKIANTALFVVVYDNINMMVRIAEQILGRKSELYHR